MNQNFFIFVSVYFPQSSLKLLPKNEFYGILLFIIKPHENRMHFLFVSTLKAPCACTNTMQVDGCEGGVGHFDGCMTADDIDRAGARSGRCFSLSSMDVLLLL